MYKSVLVNDHEWRKDDSIKRLEFLNFYANQRKLFSNILDIDEFYIKFNNHRKRSLYEVSNFKELINENKIIIRGIENIDLNNPNLFYSFRYGPMMLIPFLLKHLGVSLDFIAGNSSMKKKEKFLVASKNAGLGFKKDDIVIGDSLAGAYKIFKDKKLGKSFFCSSDVGVGMSKNDNNKIVQIKLNDQELHTRIGPAFLAHRLNIPFVGVSSVRIADKIHIEFDDPIYVIDPVESTKEIWENKFNIIVNRDPSQWESLHYINKHFVITGSIVDKLKLNELKNYKFNNLRFEFIIRDQGYFLFDMQTTKTLKLKAQLFDLLKALREENKTISSSECLSIFSKELLFQLHCLKILI